jgi:hypothetical protein
MRSFVAAHRRTADESVDEIARRLTAQRYLQCVQPVTAALCFTVGTENHSIGLWRWLSGHKRTSSERAESGLSSQCRRTVERLCHNLAVNP